MDKRKIQLVAGTTYSISIPKSWVAKNSLKEGMALSVFEQEDGSLSLSKTDATSTGKHKITINADDFPDNLDNVLIKVYYLGFDEIQVRSKNMKKDVRTKIRSLVPLFIGTEIANEDENNITLHVLLDKSKVDAIQSIHRMSLIVDQMLHNILEEISMEELKLDEDEIDRLYHLLTKMLSISSTDSAILKTSKIENVSHITHYMLIVKRFEVIADNIYKLALYLTESHKKLVLAHKRAVVDFLSKEIKRSMRHVMGGYPSVFALPSKTEINTIYGYIDMMQDAKIKEHLSYSVKLLMDIEEDIISISFSKRMGKIGAQN